MDTDAHTDAWKSGTPDQLSKLFGLAERYIASQEKLAEQGKRSADAQERLADAQERLLLIAAENSKIVNKSVKTMTKAVKDAVVANGEECPVCNETVKCAAWCYTKRHP